jgi:peptidoglycan/LPS O-acetylase OafA/YrhL
LLLIQMLTIITEKFGPFRMNYIKQLDSVRAIAVFLVITWHWVPRNSVTENLHSGSLGVDVFFVLSGFLITQILLSDRNKAESLNSSRSRVLKNFYVRRILRIFPIYYLTILLGSLLNHQFSLGITTGETRSNLTYTSNFFIYQHKAWPIASLHFWSLAVEEQFYLLWPLLILFLPKKSLPFLMAFFITVGVASQLLIPDQEFGHLPTNTCLDCFGIGALLAYCLTFHPSLLHSSKRILGILAAFSFVALAVAGLFVYELPCTRFLHALISVWLISYILVYQGRKSFIISLLDSRALINVGKVSYGMYLYHVLYVYVASSLWYKYVYDHYSAYIEKMYEPWIFLFINLPVLYGIAWLSWRFIEKPFLSLKHKFGYDIIENNKMAHLATVPITSFVVQPANQAPPRSKSKV